VLHSEIVETSRQVSATEQVLNVLLNNVEAESLPVMLRGILTLFNQTTKIFYSIPERTPS